MDCDGLLRSFGNSLLNLQFLDSLVDRNPLAGLAVEHGVQDIQQEFIFILMGYDYVVAMQEVLLRCSCCSFQSRNHFCIIGFSVIEGRLILEDNEESSCNCFT